jgi:hypothetical protein
VVHAAGDQWLRGPAPSDLKVIVVDIDRASIDALSHLAVAAGDDGAARRGGGDRASSGRYRRSAHWQMRQAKPTVAEVDMRASFGSRLSMALDNNERSNRGGAGGIIGDFLSTGKK